MDPEEESRIGENDESWSVFSEFPQFEIYCAETATLELYVNKNMEWYTYNQTNWGIQINVEKFFTSFQMAHLVNSIGMEHLRMRKEDGEPEKRKQSLWGNGGAMANWGWGDPPALKKGILLQQKEKHFLARWKERYCILTRDYLHCFRRTTSIHRSGVRLSEMGNFIFKVNSTVTEMIGDDSTTTQEWESMPLLVNLVKTGWHWGYSIGDAPCRDRHFHSPPQRAQNPI